MQRLTVILTLLLSQTLSAQIYIGGFLGGSGYNGDLNAKAFASMKPAIGLSAAYPITNRLNIRLGFLQTGLEASDAKNGDIYLQQNRNLSFKTNLSEVSLVGELMAFDLNKKNWTPYVFGGLALFHFNPYTMDNGRKVYLQPLSTEGQGLAEYPSRKTYSLNALAIPFGGGVKLVAGNKIIIGVEMGLRRTNTDYIDDLSQSYVDGDVLEKNKGALSKKLSYRADEVAGGIPAYPDNGYPAFGVERGGPKYKDWYYTGGVHIIFRLDHLGKKSSEKKSYGCNTISPL